MCHGSAYRRLIGSGVLALAVLFAVGLGGGPSWAQRTFFIIATGPTSGTYFPIGEAIAGLVSHPPGLHRCEAAGVCGPEGLIASAQTSEGTIANVTDVNAHRVNSGLAQADVVAEAIAGTGAFAKRGKQSHIAVIAALFPEELHLVVAKSAKIKSVEGLRGKRVSLGDPGSGTIVTAKAVLAAYRIPARRIKALELPSDMAADALENGKLDAFFFMGGAPVGLVNDLIADGKAELLPIDGDGRKRLIAREPALSADAIATGTYAGQGAVQTVSVRALWIVNDAEPVNLVYGITKALFNPANGPLLDQAHPAARLIRVDAAAQALPAPLHPGAVRFFREIGKLPKPAAPAVVPTKRAVQRT